MSDTIQQPEVFEGVNGGSLVQGPRGSLGSGFSSLEFRGTSVFLDEVTTLSNDASLQEYYQVGATLGTISPGTFSTTITPSGDNLSLGQLQRASEALNGYSIFRDEPRITAPISNMLAALQDESDLSWMDREENRCDCEDCVHPTT